MNVSDVVRQYAKTTHELINDSEIDRLEALEYLGLVSGTDLLAISEGQVRLEEWLTQREALAAELRGMIASHNAKEPVPESLIQSMRDPMRRDQVRQLLEEGRLDRNIVSTMLTERRSRELTETISLKWLHRQRELDRSLGHER